MVETPAPSTRAIRLNTWYKNLLSLPCPDCQAAVGVGCRGSASVACAGRVNAAERLRKTPLYLPGTRWAPGRNPTSKCRRSACGGCSGRHQRRHGMPGLPCTCECHKPLESEQNTRTETKVRYAGSVRSRALKPGLSGMFDEHTRAVYSFMKMRVERLDLFLPFTLAEFRAWLLKEVFSGSAEKAIQCTYCRDWMHAGNFVMDHKDPVCYGGSVGFENLTPACASCNTLKGRMAYESFLAFLRMIQTLPPRDVNDLVGRMKNGAAYIRVQAAARRMKSVAVRM
jgi:hypothetical protein